MRVSTVIKNKEAIKKADVAKEVKAILKQHSQTFKGVERLLLIWVNKKQLVGDSVSEGMICQKAKLLHAKIILKRGPGIHSVVRHGEAANANKKTADEICLWIS